MAVISFFTVLFLCVFTVSSFNHIYQTHQFIERAGYVAETHHVTTQDGYILEMHRIPFRRHETSGAADRPVVYILHGMMGASNNFIVLGRHYGMAYNLADAGFDVWLGNARGTRNSRRHVSLDPDVDRLEFFDFSWNEIGLYDVPAMIDYILDLTGNQRLHYLGHSQGGTSFLVMASARPEYNQRIATAHLLAPAGYTTYFPNDNTRARSAYIDIIWTLAKSVGIVEIFPPNPIIPFSDHAQTEDLWQYCAGDPKFKDFCMLTGIKEIMENIFPDDDDDHGRVLPAFGGIALKQLVHYNQNIRDYSFRRWNYGTIGNIIRYGTPQPPIYNLAFITADVTIHYTISDNLVGVNDVHAMNRDMPKSKVRRIAKDSFSHLGFFADNDVRELVTEYIIDSIANYN